MTWLTPRKWFFFVFAACAGLMAVAVFYFQNYLMMFPCPLCVFQRIAFIAMGAFAVIGFLHNPGRAGRKVYGLLITVAGLAGIGTAWYHLWMQSLPPDQVPACGPPLDILLDNLGWIDAVRTVFSGAGSCAEVSWRFLGLSMPGWTLVWYVLLTAVTLWVCFRRDKPKRYFG